MSDIWGRQGRQYYWLQVDNISELESWIVKDNINVDYHLNGGGWSLWSQLDNARARRTWWQFKASTPLGALAAQIPLVDPEITPLIGIAHGQPSFDRGPQPNFRLNRFGAVLAHKV
jgi:hypothetical protein